MKFIFQRKTIKTKLKYIYIYSACQLVIYAEEKSLVVKRDRHC